MKTVFKEGDRKTLSFTVGPKDLAAFNERPVHPVCSTYTLAREIEWATRQYVLDMKEEHEDGIGTHLSIDHISPAFEGERIDIRSWIKEINGNELICGYEAKVSDRLIARGDTGQKILTKAKIEEIFSNLKDG